MDKANDSFAKYFTSHFGVTSADEEEVSIDELLLDNDNATAIFKDNEGVGFVFSTGVKKNGKIDMALKYSSGKTKILHDCIPQGELLEETNIDNTSINITFQYN